MYKWVRTGRTVSAEGTTITYEAEGTNLKIESRRRAIPHANRNGFWYHTTFFVVQDGADLIEKYALQDAKEYVEEAAGDDHQ